MTLSQQIWRFIRSVNGTRLMTAAAISLGAGAGASAWAGTPALSVETKISSVDGDGAYEFPGFGAAGLMVVQVFVENLLPGDAVTSVFGDSTSPLTISTSATAFFNANHANANGKPNPANFENAPPQQWDTWLAVDDAPLFIVIPVDLDIGLAGGGSDINEHTNLAWVPSPPGVGVVTATGRVLIGQFAFAEDSDFDISVSLSVIRGGSTIEVRDLSYSIAGPEPTGACCVDGNCTEVSEAICTLLGQITGSVYYGDGTACMDVDCAVPPPTGACCVSGVCSEIASAACTLAGGTFSGAGTLCADIECDATPQTGACCIVGVCSEIEEAACTLAGGTFSGAGTLCADIDCDAEPKNGACCVDGKCVEVTEDVCTLLGQVTTSVFHGVGTTCAEIDCSAPETGACCIVGECQELTEDICALATGTFSGVGTTCETTSCDIAPTTGACCLRGLCQELTQQLCTLAGGVFSGLGTECDGDACAPPALGACCVDLQCFQRTQQACANNGGTFHGVGTPCDDVDCDPGPPVGGCCVNRECVIALEETCDMLGGTFYGVGVSCLSRQCAQTDKIEGSACMSEYWRQSRGRQPDFSHWPEQYSPTTALGDVFDMPACVVNSGFRNSGDYRNSSLLDVLAFHMGPGLSGTAKAMYSEAVAAILNAQKTQNGDCDMNYPFTDPQQVIELTNYVAATCDHNLVRELTDMFAAYNRLGCPCRFTQPRGR